MSSNGQLSEYARSAEPDVPDADNSEVPDDRLFTADRYVIKSSMQQDNSFPAIAAPDLSAHTTKMQYDRGL